MIGYLGLATGDIFPGELISAGDLTPGEVILYRARKFHFQILTDPANYGRIIVSDSAIIENRWPIATEIESYSPHLKALVMLGNLKASALQDSHYNLVNYFHVNGITLFKPSDPPALRNYLDRHGAVPGIVTPDKESVDQLFERPYPDSISPAAAHGEYKTEFDPVQRLSTRLEYFWDLHDQRPFSDAPKKYLLVAYDLGMTYSTLRNLKKLGCDIRVVPADYSPEDVIALKPEGILVAGGPGYPGDMDYAISNISRLIGLRPILATGLGAVLLALAAGAKIEIMKKPHFGDSISVRIINGGQHSHSRTIKTNQNHRLTIDKTSLEKEGFKLTLINPADRTVEGFEHRDYLIHAYAFPLGGEDDFTISCLQSFINIMEAHRAARNP